MKNIIKMRTLNVIIFTTLAVLFQACGGNSSESEKDTKATLVTSEIIQLSTVPKISQYTGTVASVNQSTLSTRLLGQVKKVYVSEGDVVKEGQLLVSIRSNDIKAKKQQVEANILQAESAFKHATDDFKRINNLFSSNSATQKELDDITVHYEMTKAQLEVAKKAKDEVDEMLSYANISAPYSGVITQKFIESGDMANPGMPLLAIEAPRLYEVRAKVPEIEIYKIEKGDKAEVWIDASNQAIPGIITHISPSSRFSGTQFEVRISLQPNEIQQSLIRSGLFARVNHLKGEERKLLVDEKLVIERGQLNGVWTISKSNQALLRWVRLGKTYGAKVEVISGLSINDILITSSTERLFDGTKIQVN